MIYHLAQDVEQALLARHYPVSVVYGPEQCTRGVGSYVIVVERDTERTENVRAPVQASRNPRKYYDRALTVRVRVFVRSSLPGARLNEHQHECDALVDALLVELYKWGAEHRAGAVEFVECRYLAPEEVSLVTGTEHRAGVVYQIRFDVLRGVAELMYEGAARSTATLAGMRHEIEISHGAATEAVASVVIVEFPAEMWPLTTFQVRGTVSGIADGATISVLLGGQPFGTAVVSGGNWTVEAAAPAVAAGPQVLTAKVNGGAAHRVVLVLESEP